MMNPMGHPSEGSSRPDLFHPTSLTEEEANVMRQLRYESAWKRGYPLAFASGAVTAFLTKRFNTVPRVALTAFSAIIGNITGRISYLPTIHQRLLTDLPPDSPLRQRMELLKEKGPSALAEQLKDQNMGASPYNPNSPSENSREDETAYDDPLEKPLGGTIAPKKFITYEELRQRNRQSSSNLGGYGQYNTNPSPVQNQEDSELPEMTADQDEPSKRVRYNKYGDAIIE